LSGLLSDHGEDGGQEDGGDGGVKNAKYKAPRMAPVHFDASEGLADDKKKTSKREQREAEREAILSSRTRLMADVQAELDDDLPVEEAIDPVYSGARPGRAESARPRRSREAYEEENFVRLTLSKGERKRLGTEAKPVDELADLNDFFREHQKKRSSGSAGQTECR
jgi:hypothetical protein